MGRGSLKHTQGSSSGNTHSTIFGVPETSANSKRSLTRRKRKNADIEKRVVVSEGRGIDAANPMNPVIGPAAIGAAAIGAAAIEAAVPVPDESPTKTLDHLLAVQGL